MHTRQETQWEQVFLGLLLDLIELSDAFDQLGKLAVLCDMLYDPTDPEHPILFKALEKTARHLRGNRNIGSQEAQSAKDARDLEIEKSQKVFDKDRFNSRAVR